jgi:SAM-dependent methyltransferase
MTRDKYTEKFTKPVLADQIGMRLATPEIVAEYIAKRLSTHTIADLGCGIGIQAIFFAKYCAKVYAVELDVEKLEYARKNARLYGVSNIEFIHGDVLSEDVIGRVSDVDVIFSDPARPFEEAERSLEHLSPPILEVIEKYQRITDNMAFHLPPKIDPEKITFDCEREYLSLHSQLNRFTVYLGGLKRCNRSAVVLPQRVRLESKAEPQTPSRAENCRAFLFEPQPSVVHAGLLGELIEQLPEDTQLYYSDKIRTLLTSNKPAHSPFLKDCYRVIQTMDFDVDRIKKALQARGDVGKVVLRFQIEPSEYWSVRRVFEAGLVGSKTVHLFRCNGTAVLCEKIKGRAE